VRQRAQELRGRADDLRRQANAGLETASGRYPTVRWVVDAYERDRERFGGMLAGGLAFKLFIWLVPYTLLVVTVLGFAASYGDRDPAQLAKSAGLSSALVSIVAKAVEGSGRGRIFLLLLGLWLALWSGRGLVRSLAVISTAAWDLPIRTARASWKGSVVLLGIMTLLFATQLLDGLLYRGALPTDLFASLVMVGLTAAIWLGASFLLPHRREEVPWTALIPGAVLVALSARVLAIVTTVYFADKLTRADDLYGSIGLATVFLAWLFIVARVVVAATFLNASRWFAAHPAGAGPA
jgi:uncharacterized BrkB/YihY/UPF0761 family membrane protein